MIKINAPDNWEGEEPMVPLSQALYQASLNYVLIIDRDKTLMIINRP